MALIVEDGTGRPDSESYASVADADAYHLKYGNDSWAAASNDQKEKALRKATRYLDIRYSRRWLGERVKPDQALMFPRFDIYDLDGMYVGSTTGFYLDPTIIPVRLKYATSEMAWHALTEDILPDFDLPAYVESESVRVGPISTSTSYAGSKPLFKQYTTANGLLFQLLRASAQIERS